MGPVRLTVHTGMTTANAGPTLRRSLTLLAGNRTPSHGGGTPFPGFPDPAYVRAARETPGVTAGLTEGMRALLARRTAEMDGGARPLGWKIGFNSVPIQQHFALSGPVVGYLTDATLFAPGTAVPIGGWSHAALEVEVAVRVGDDGGVAGLGPALELVDLNLGFDDLEPILAGNVFHRGVVFGPEVPGVDVDGLEVEVRRDGAVVATGMLEEPPAVTVEAVRSFLNAHGAQLMAGDRIIAGSMIPALAVAPGERLSVGFGRLGDLDVQFA